MSTFRFAALLFLSLIASSSAMAAESTMGVLTPPSDAKDATATEIKPKNETVAIVPHRAIYKMEMGNVKNGSDIVKVNGRMFFEWANACDGWAVQQKLQLHFFYKEGSQADIDSTVVTWESKDGKNYTFNVRRLTDGKETENYRGKATTSENGGESVYTVPEEKKVKLKEGSIFPSTHTIMIIQKALEGKKLFMKPVFDGSDEEGYSDVSAFINEKKENILSTEMNPSLKDNPLLKEADAWPVRLAFFKPDSQTGEPDYEMNLLILRNGVTKAMQIDYNDFSVNGVLEQIEPLPDAGCHPNAS